MMQRDNEAEYDAHYADAPKSNFIGCISYQTRIRVYASQYSMHPCRSISRYTEPSEAKDIKIQHKWAIDHSSFTNY